MKPSKKIIAFLWLTVLASGIASVFWYVDFVYSLPTPVPEEHKVIAIGSRIALTEKSGRNSSKPLFLHFFNPDCPCSRFNIPHFKTLVNQYSNEIQFVIVPISFRPIDTQEILDKFGLDIPVVLDPTIAAACGVYSTPQAVILSSSSELVFRGNYNRSRYCSDKKTEYARLALAAFLNNDSTFTPDNFALKAYGCQVPNCKK